MDATTEATIYWSGWVHPKGTLLIVTGAGSGIGQATAVVAAQQGLRVAAWDINPDGVQRTIRAAGEHGSSITPVIADVSKQEAVTQGMAETLRIGKPKLLVNNAGPVAIGTNIVFEAALTAAVCSVQMMVEAFLATEPGEGAAIVNISSVVGPIVAGGSAWYNAAKAGIAGYTKFLAATIGSTCRVNSILPGGPIRTPRNQAFIDKGAFEKTLSRNPMKRPGRPEEVAAAILFLLAPAASYVNGVLLPVDGGLTVAE
jgi:NAD(P)-dependent dehydrogenase (short-subunit alcohol dehydrogenase family)